MTGHAKMTSNKYKFDTVFVRGGGNDAAREQPTPNAKKVYSQAEIDKLTTDAHSEGMRSGQIRAIEALGQAADRASAVLREALSQSHGEIEKVREEACKFALAIARKLATAAVTHLPALDVEHALREAMHQAIGEPRIVLRANPAVIEVLATRTEAIAHEEGFEGRLIVHAEPSLKDADCRIEWRGGGAERNQTAIEHALAELVTRRFTQHPSVKE
jgi:flagellar assembly protein FliH